MEYASIIWSPHNVKLLKSVESVQGPFTKRLVGCGQLSLDSLELRCLKAELTYVYKILFRLVDVSCADMF